MNDVTLDTVSDADVLAFHAHLQDEPARRMAAFVGADRSLEGHVEHWRRILASPTVTARTIRVDGEVAGHVATFEMEGELEVTFWIDRALWGRGVATRALGALLEEVTRRPVHARAAKDNIGSRRVLEKVGFAIVGDDRGHAEGRGEEVDEWVFRLDAKTPPPAQRADGGDVGHT